MSVKRRALTLEFKAKASTVAENQFDQRAFQNQPASLPSPAMTAGGTRR